MEIPIIQFQVGTRYYAVTRDVPYRPEYKIYFTILERKKKYIIFRNEKTGKVHKAKLREYDFNDVVVEYIFTNRTHNHLWALHNVKGEN